MSGTFVGEGEVVVFRQDDMVYEGDVHHSAGRADALGLFDVTLTGSGITGRMVVSHKDLCGIVEEGPAQDGAGIDDGCVEAAFGEHLNGDDAVVLVEEQGPELFVVELGEAGFEQAGCLAALVDTS